MLNIIVTGGAGFIGSHLCKRLINEGHTVFCLDNLISGDKANIVSLLDNPRFAYLEFDVTQSFAPLMDRFRDIEYIFHLASPASPNKKSERSYINHPIETLLVNSLGTYNLLKLAQEKNAAFLFASTSEVYGNPIITPQPETYFGNVNPNGIRSVYDEAKRFGEATTFAFRRTFNIDARIVRIFNTYGPFMHREDGRVISTFVNQALHSENMSVYGNGEQTRSFCYVDDMVDGIMKAMFTKGTAGEVINLGNPDERKIKDIAILIKTLVSSHSQVVFEPLPADDPLQRKPDITKAKSLLGWNPTVTLEDGLKKTIEHFRNIG